MNIPLSQYRKIKFGEREILCYRTRKEVWGKERSTVADVGSTFFVGRGELKNGGDASPRPSLPSQPRRVLRPLHHKSRVSFTGQPPRVNFQVKLSGQWRPWQATPARAFNWKVHAGPPGVLCMSAREPAMLLGGQAPGSRIAGTLARLRGLRASADCRQSSGRALGSPADYYGPECRSFRVRARAARSKVQVARLRGAAIGRAALGQSLRVRAPLLRRYAPRGQSDAGQCGRAPARSIKAGLLVGGNTGRPLPAISHDCGIIAAADRRVAGFLTTIRSFGKRLLRSRTSGKAIFPVSNSRPGGVGVAVP